MLRARKMVLSVRHVGISQQTKTAVFTNKKHELLPSPFIPPAPLPSHRPCVVGLRICRRYFASLFLSIPSPQSSFAKITSKFIICIFASFCLFQVSGTWFSFTFQNSLAPSRCFSSLPATSACFFPPFLIAILALF